MRRLSKASKPDAKGDETIFTIAVTAPVLVKNLALSLKTGDATFSDNYFDLLPNETVIIRCKPAVRLSIKAFEADLALMYMAQVVAG